MVLVLGISHGIGIAVSAVVYRCMHGGDVGGIAMEWVGVFVNMCNHHLLINIPADQLIECL